MSCQGERCYAYIMPKVRGGNVVTFLAVDERGLGDLCGVEITGRRCVACGSPAVTVRMADASHQYDVRCTQPSSGVHEGFKACGASYPIGWVMRHDVTDSHGGES